MARRYPGFSISECELVDGVLAYAGEVRVDLGDTVHLFPVILIYHAETPFRYPSLIPVIRLPNGDSWSLSEALRRENIFWMPSGRRRHQMAEGALCLIEGDARVEAERLSGVAVIARAQEVFRALALGTDHPFPDTQEAELEEHFEPWPADIILGDAFYEPGLHGGGSFRAIPTLDDHTTLPTYVEQTDGSRRLYLGLHVTAHGPDGHLLETEWRTERSAALRAAFPFLGDQRLDFERQAMDERAMFSSLGVTGSWFDLAREPEPVRNVRELEELIRNLAGVPDPIEDILRYAGDMREVTRVFVGLRFPAREGGVDWLFLGVQTREGVTTEMEEKEGAGVRRNVLRAGYVGALRRHALRRSSLEIRNGAIAGALAQRTVLLLGAGALGGDVAETLGKAGVGTLIIADYDRMRPGNSIRHVAGLAAAGLNKSDAVRHVVRQHNPFVVVEAVPSSATARLEDLERLLKRADLVVSTIADENTEHVVNEAAVRLNRTVIYGRALRAGSAARVFRVKPMRDACKACMGLYREAARAGQDTARESTSPEWVNVPEVEGEIIARECGNPVLAGSAVDLRFAADFTARAALDALQQIGAGTAQGGDGWNSLVWTREGLPDAAVPELQRPYGTILQRIPPHPACPVCVSPRNGSILLTASAERDLRTLAESKTDRETGGALIGFETTAGRIVVLTVTDAGPKAVETSARFVYDPDHVNERLRQAHDRMGDRGMYVGEWHTHLEPDPFPSPRDAMSLSAIAEEPAYLTNEPIMLIAGVDPTDGRVKQIHASCWPNQRAMREIELVTGVNDDVAAGLPLRDGLA
jgi:integrative and conjugative element protein (TIGR02256 family)